ncbi:hypothetical protein K7432_002599 [Basidiobolus ranarum]|uniref:Domain of unknown function at the cortex 1 domain-containing protein n=1 Tax=Basidiobolus ranarum TaxID=34480 RepID=A0ABR2X1A8_9FUNG
MMYKLRVRAGTDTKLDNLKVIKVNDEENPIQLESPHFTGQLVVRIRDYDGLTPDGSKPIKTSLYFEGNKDQYSIQIQGRFKQQWNADEVVFGNTFDKKLNLPYGAGVALKVAKWIDPGLDADIHSDQPWAFSPLLVTMNTVNIKPAHEELELSKELVQHIEEDTSSLLEQNLSPNERRDYLSKLENRINLPIRTDAIYQFDFFNPYINFNTHSLLLPGFELNVMKYYDGQPLRYVAQTRDGKTIFFVVVFELVPEEELQNEEQTEAEIVDNDID